jgi:hypothetical protein
MPRIRICRGAGWTDASGRTQSDTLEEVMICQRSIVERKAVMSAAMRSVVETLLVMAKVL